MKKTILLLILIILVSTLLILPLFQSGYLKTHDGEWAVVRLGSMHRAFIDHHFPVRWSGNLNFGYGYPLFQFTYPLPYYLGEAFNLMGLGLIASVKLVFILSVILSGITMFLLARVLFGNFGGVISSIFYIYAPYRIVDLYVRGSIGESLSLALFPLLFYLSIKISKEQKLLYVAFFSIAYGVLLLTHNVMALLFSPYLVGFCFILWLKSSKDIKLMVARNYIFAVLLGIGLASFFLFPAIIEKKLIILSQAKLADISQNFVSAQELFIPSWNYGSFGTSDSFSPQLGLVHIVTFLISILILISMKRKISFIASYYLLFAFGTTILLVLPLSFIFWHYIPLYSDIDFPWRILGLTAFFMSLFIGVIATNKHLRILNICLILLVIIVNLPNAKPTSYTNLPDSYYFTNEATTTSADELMPIWVKYKPRERAEKKVEIVSGKGDITYTSNSVSTNISLNLAEDSIIRVNTIYFPGWEATIDGKKTEVNYNNDFGVMGVNVNKGAHEVKLLFKETELRLFSDLISAISLIIILVIISNSILNLKSLQAKLLP